MIPPVLPNLSHMSSITRYNICLIVNYTHDIEDGECKFRFVFEKIEVQFKSMSLKGGLSALYIWN